MKMKNLLLAFSFAATLSISALPLLAQASSTSQNGYLDLSSPEVQAELAKEELKPKMQENS